MKLLIAGGGLQGVEAAFLAEKAGWEAMVADKRPNPPAKSLAGGFRRVNLETCPESELVALAKDFDCVLPALEDMAVIDRLSRLGALGLSPVVAIDPQAYRISSSKLLSKELFMRLGLPVAAPWRPEASGRAEASGASGDFKGEARKGTAGPFVAKPSGLSGSRGVLYFESEEDLEKALPGLGRDMVIESRLEGPQYSIEVTAKNGVARAWQATRLEMDELSDCRLVEAPSDLSPQLEERFASMACKIASALSLTGLMDLEAILHDGVLTLLEIDARLPSQTPIAVWRSTGVNLLVELVRCFASVDAPPPGPMKAKARVVLEHVKSRGGTVSRHGEHLMTSRGPLRVEPGLLGSEAALVAGDPKDFVATLISAKDFMSL